MDDVNAPLPDHAPPRVPGASGARGSKALAVLPVALLSVAWTTHLTGYPGAISALAQGPSTRMTPAPTAAEAPVAVPPDPVEVPTSLSALHEVTTATDRSFTPVLATPSTGDIPSAALAAYQRAETVINAADATCHLRWQLVAAIGRVESDHGRSGGSTIGADGVVRPSILGPVLDGRAATSMIRDSDAGQYDGDTRFDRAVGPLQFIPSTWSVVGVDADDDGVRDPQDIDDAALAAAVYLCSGTEDLAGDAGRRASVLRYNHSQSYVATVLSIMNGYLAGDFDSMPGSTVSAGSLVPLEPLAQVAPPGPLGSGSTLVAAEQLALADTHGEALSLPPVQVPPDLPSIPVDPAEPVDPSEPTVPTGPTDPPVPPVPPTDPPAPGDAPADPPGVPTTPPAPGDDPTDPADPAEPTEPTEPTEPSEAAVASCTEAGYVDDLAVDVDEFDLCVIAFDEAASDPGSADGSTGEPSGTAGGATTDAAPVQANH